MNILLTGGCGYIGSHTAVALLERGHQVVLLDNFANSERSVPSQIEKITQKAITFVEGDVKNVELVTQIIAQHQIEGVIHLAGLKAVAESVAYPTHYYGENINGAISLVKAMQAQNVRRLVFSSSATVYGTPHYLPLNEQHPLGPENPYGRTKWHIEQMLSDVAHSEGGWRILNLRYFNPVGAHESGLIGERPVGTPNNVMPVILDVAAGRRDQLSIFGSDYSTRDGSAIRDYIHVMDLAEGHVQALEFTQTSTPTKANGSVCDFINLGTGKGTTVLELVRAFERALGRAIPKCMVDRRPGDVAECYAATDKATKLLNFSARRDLNQVCESAVKFAGLKSS
jgi:UDP-glucose 4-epimerase